MGTRCVAHVDTPFSNEQVQELYEITSENKIQLQSLHIESNELSNESIHLMSLIAPSPEDKVEREECRNALNR